jgi:hypothetical protein
MPRTPDAVFTVVRDPVARMVSEYRYQRSGRLTGPFGRPVRGLGFSAWLRLMFAMADRNPYTHDNHFRPQVEFMPPDGVTVFRLEDGLAPVLGWLAEIAGEPAPEAAPHDLKTSGGPHAIPSAPDKAMIQNDSGKTTSASAMPLRSRCGPRTCRVPAHCAPLRPCSTRSTDGGSSDHRTVGKGILYASLGVSVANGGSPWSVLSRPEIR